MTTKAQKEAQRRYDRKMIRSVTIRLHVIRDRDIINYLDSLANKQGTIKNLIREKIFEKRG